MSLHRTAEFAPNPALEASLVEVESSLLALGQALRERNAAAIERDASSLQNALTCAVDHFSRAARSGPIPSALRHRLASASGQVAAQRESLARATAALDRAIEVLIPSTTPSLYSAQGAPHRVIRSSMLQA
jgi:hypothetical protein